MYSMTANFIFAPGFATAIYAIATLTFMSGAVTAGAMDTKAT
jgi:hypothetical protein